jgi:polysaccharide export outer membrane protein
MNEETAGQVWSSLPTADGHAQSPTWDWAAPPEFSDERDEPLPDSAAPSAVQGAPTEVDEAPPGSPDASSANVPGELPVADATLPLARSDSAQPESQASPNAASPPTENLQSPAPETASLPEQPPAPPEADASPARPESAPEKSVQLRRVPAGRRQRSRAVELAAREADLHTQRAFDLASRGARFAARAEFIQALRLVSQTLDTENQVADHSRALAAGLLAMREAQDFLPAGSRLEADLDMPGLVAGHRTPVLKDAPSGAVTPQTALGAYFTYAQQQLATAVGVEIAGSMAFHGLGKLHAATASRTDDAVRASQPKSMAFFQAALLVYPQNYMASNDLGVLLARANRYEDSRAALEHSVGIQPTFAGWHNLAMVYQRLGDRSLAQHAARIAESTRQLEASRTRQRGTPGRGVQWVDSGRFADSYRPPEVGPRPANPASQPARTGSTAALDPPTIRLCQALEPVGPSLGEWSAVPWFNGSGGDWEADRAAFWQGYAQGEYVARARTAHVAEYRLRPDDQLDMIYRVTREETSQPYKLNVGDEVRVESLTDQSLNRDLLIQPDGTITVQLLGQVRATGKTVTQLRKDLEEAYLKYYKVPAVSVTPLKTNTKLEDLRATVDRRAGIGGQSQFVRVTPEGTISLPAIGTVPAQGLTLQELQHELNERYREQIEGMEVIPVLMQRAPRFVYVLGEVRNPGRFELVAPTTVIQAISLAGGWNVGSNLRQVVVFRRDDNWQLLATMVNLQAPLYARQCNPCGEIWLSDSDIVIVPKGKILIADEFVDLVFTRGIYGVFPLVSTISFAKLSTL